MTRILALDTSTEACSVAVLDGTHVEERYSVAPREHMLRLLPMVDELLAAHQWRLGDLDAIAFGRGPGSFTGLRICLGVVQGLAFGAGLPVIPVSTLATLAQTALTDAMPTGAAVLAAIDARMSEIYCGWFDITPDRVVAPLSDEIVSAPEAVIVPDMGNRARYGAGTGWSYGERLAVTGMTAVDSQVLPRAGAMLRLAEPMWRAGQQVAPEEALPVYLRDQVAWQKSSP